MKDLLNKRYLSIIALIIMVFSTLFFYFGSKSMPWELQTWGGDSIEEIEFREGSNRKARVGFILLSIGFSLQLITKFKARDLKSLKKFFKI